MREGGRLDNDPSRKSLRLLPSGPDRVGDKLARRQSPARNIGCLGQKGKREKENPRDNARGCGERRWIVNGGVSRPSPAIPG